MTALPRARIEPSARLARLAPDRVARELRQLLEDGAPLHVAGSARRDPPRLIRRHPARARVELFDTTYYLAAPRQNPDLRFMVAYVVQPSRRTHHRGIFARLFYKDVSLLWRCASHFLHSGSRPWIGKGAVRTEIVDGVAIDSSAEETTDLPLEIQTALESAFRRAHRIPRDEVAVAQVLRRGPAGRIEPYRDFTAPRERAMRDPRDRIHRGRPIARFTRRNDPTSLRFVRGYEPDLRAGVVERARSRSQLYGGTVRRFRILSTNRRIQYLFLAGKRHVWIAPPQATTTELMSYGVRTVDVIADEHLCVPGYEYHFMDETRDPPQLHSQIPEGFAGAPSAEDPLRADASAWIERLPVVREFRRRILQQPAQPPGE